jgi:hypothetical protein
VACSRMDCTDLREQLVCCVFCSVCNFRSCVRSGEEDRTLGQQTYIHVLQLAVKVTALSNRNVSERARALQSVYLQVGKYKLCCADACRRDGELV